MERYNTQELIFNMCTLRIHAKEGLYLTYMMHEGKHFMWNFTKYLASKRKEADWAMGHRRSITQSKEKLY
jgi:glutathione peroxidase-family protein